MLHSTYDRSAGDGCEGVSLAENREHELAEHLRHTSVTPGWSTMRCASVLFFAAVAAGYRPAVQLHRSPACTRTTNVQMINLFGNNGSHAALDTAFALAALAAAAHPPSAIALALSQRRAKSSVLS